MIDYAVPFFSLLVAMNLFSLGIMVKNTRDIARIKQYLNINGFKYRKKHKC